MERQRFTAEFKREAVRLMERGDKPVAQLALELGVPRNRLYKWREALQTEGVHAFRGSGRRSPQQQKQKRGQVHFPASFLGRPRGRTRTSRLARASTCSRKRSLPQVFC